MSLFIITLLIAGIFYLLLPLSGAFAVRRGWRGFRNQISDAGVHPELSYADPERNAEGYAGCYRFIGDLQAIQNDSSVWLNNGSLSVKAELADVKIYMLPTSRTMDSEDRIEKNEHVLPAKMPKKLKWEKVYSLAQRTGFLLYGAVYIENGNPVFTNTEEHPLLVIIYDGKRETILRRSIWCGRQLNEYWNSLTPVSLLAGSFFLFVLAYIFFRRADMRPGAVLILITSLIPGMPFLPPGILFYSIYRRLWRKGRLLRGERDLLRLPLRFFQNGDPIKCVTAKFESVREAITAYPDANVRSCGIIDDAELMSHECRVFLSPDYQDKKKSDPLFENLIIPGDPDALSIACRKKARFMELSAMVSLGLTFLINSLIIYLILIRLL